MLLRIFRTFKNTKNGGIIGINKQGQVLSITIDEDNFIPFVAGTLRDAEMAMRLTNKHDLPGQATWLASSWRPTFGTS